MRKPIVYLVSDSPGWAFEISAKDMERHSNKYEFRHVNWYDDRTNPDIFKDADLIYFFGHYMSQWFRHKLDYKKICTGIRALFDCADVRKDNYEFSKRIQTIVRYPVVHGVTQEMCDKMREFHPRVMYACHGVDHELYTMKEPSKNSKLVVGWAGNTSTKEKNYDIILQLQAQRPDIEFKFATFDNKIEDRKEMRDFYHSLDVYLLPSRSEGVSATLLEAMSCGLPVISTNTGEWGRLHKITNGGWVVDPNLVEISNAIDKAKMADLHRMGVSNRREIEENWTWKKRIIDFENFFDAALRYSNMNDSFFDSSLEYNNTQKTFDDKWKNLGTPYGRTPEQETFFIDWAIKKYGFKTVEELNNFYASKKSILEVGFGSAFNLEYISRHTDANILGVDSSKEAFNKATELFKDKPKITLMCKDLYNLPDNIKDFDLIIADGVLHHTKDTFQSIQHLYERLMPGGHMYIYLYKKMGAIREFTNETIHNSIKNMSIDDALKECEKITNLGKELSRIGTRVHVQEIASIGLPEGDYTVHELFYYGIMKCFWNDVFTYEENNLNNYDWFHPEFAWKQTEYQVKDWMNELGCSYKVNRSNLNGISIIMEKI